MILKKAKVKRQDILIIYIQTDVKFGIKQDQLLTNWFVSYIEIMMITK